MVAESSYDDIAHAYVFMFHEVEDMIIDSDKSIHTVTSVESYNEFKTGS